jgi:hypothetical protein
MRRLFSKFTFLPVILVLAGFTWFTLRIADPPDEAERESLVSGTIAPGGPLRAQGPFQLYVALERGVPGDEIPEFPLDDAQPLEDGRFELSADPGDGRRFWVLARIETARLERWCDTVRLPEMRQLEDGAWVEAATGEPLSPLELTVDDSRRCS